MSEPYHSASINSRASVKTTHFLNQSSDQLGVVKPKKEVYTQCRNQGIFLQYGQIFVNGGPTRLELVALAVGLDFLKNSSA